MEDIYVAKVEVLNADNNISKPNISRPWYMKDGQLRPARSSPGDKALALFPEEAAGDRMINQLSFVSSGLY